MILLVKEQRVVKGSIRLGGPGVVCSTVDGLDEQGAEFGWLIASAMEVTKESMCTLDAIRLVGA